MQKMADITFKENRFLLSGELAFSNVMTIYKKSLSQAKVCSELIFDFSQLQSSDSSGLALLIEWIKLSKQQQKSIRFEHLPAEIMLLAKAAGVHDML